MKITMPLFLLNSEHRNTLKDLRCFVLKTLRSCRCILWYIYQQIQILWSVVFHRRWQWRRKLEHKLGGGICLKERQLRKSPFFPPKSVWALIKGSMKEHMSTSLSSLCHVQLVFYGSSSICKSMQLLTTALPFSVLKIPYLKQKGSITSPLASLMPCFMLIAMKPEPFQWFFEIIIWSQC